MARPGVERVAPPQPTRSADRRRPRAQPAVLASLNTNDQRVLRRALAYAPP